VKPTPTVSECAEREPGSGRAATTVSGRGFSVDDVERETAV
jgi:hypothetical protein